VSKLTFRSHWIAGGDRESSCLSSGLLTWLLLCFLHEVLSYIMRTLRKQVEA